MKRYINISIYLLVFALMLLVPFSLLSCGSSTTTDGNGMAKLTLRLTDTPVDMANRVVVLFNGVTLQNSDGTRYEFPLPDQAIDLLSLTGDASEVLLNSVSVKPGQYNWIRLHVIAKIDTIDSFIEIEDPAETFTIYSLYVPSGAQTGLKINNPFIIPAGGDADFTVDFDLRKSVHKPEGLGSMINYMLRPTLRIVNNVMIGNISGNVDAALINTSGGNAVYLYSGFGVTPDDYGSPTPPLASAMVNDITGDYHIGFVAIGNYTIAFTNAADADDSLTDDNIPFYLPADITVEQGLTTTHDFVAP